VRALGARAHAFKARVVPGLGLLVAAEGLYVLTGHTHHGRAYHGLDELGPVARSFGVTPFTPR
jgi:hypothetical protein